MDNSPNEDSLVSFSSVGKKTPMIASEGSVQSAHKLISKNENSFSSGQMGSI